MRGWFLLACVVLAAAGCGEPDQPALRAKTPARRHVLLALSDGLLVDTLLDGSLVDRSHKHLDVARCTRLCAPALGPGDRVVGCFRDLGFPPDMRAQLPPNANAAILDCALQ